MTVLLLLLKVGCVFGLLALVLWVLKRTDGLGGRARTGALEVRGSTRLGKGAALTVVRVDGRELLLGVTDHAVTLLRTEDAAEPVAAAPTTAPAAPGLATRLGSTPAGRVAGLLGSAWAHRPRRRPATADPDLVAALQVLRGTPPSLGVPEGTRSTPVVADGPASPLRRPAVRRAARTDAPRDEEHPWTRACRPTFRSPDGDPALL